jgi:small-conductance mechanosensitive channel
VITDKIKGYVLTGLAILLFGLFLTQSLGRFKAERRADRADQVAKQARADLATCQGNVINLDAARKAQNSAVESLQRQAEARVAESRKAAQQARAVAQSYREEAARILAARPGSVDRCDAARKLIEEYAE